MPKLLRLSIIALLFAFTSDGFKKQQLSYPRVRAAFAAKEQLLLQDIRKMGISENGLKLYLRGFKKERKLEAWVSSGGPFQLLRSYDFCNFSGVLGPKRRRGDGQIPEGLYTLDYYNPSSAYLLSMRVSYPNASDTKRTTGSSTGGDIYIHGGCATIGCIPITDDKIKELYTLAVMAKDASGANVPIHMFPFEMTQENLAANGNTHTTFWKELEPFYSAFERNHMLPVGRIMADGRYQMQ